MKKIFIGYLSIFLFIGLSSCEPEQLNQPLKIAISKAVPFESYQYYVKWLKDADSSILYYDMYSLGIDSALELLRNCDGLLLTGGEDINPIYYGCEFDSLKCDQPNNYRDSLELLLIENALTHNMPIMGICRGLQLLNVYFGGTLIFDIPTDYDTIVKHRQPAYNPARHNVNIMEGSLMHQITYALEGNTNSNHHQGIDGLAPLLSGATYTQDGLIESIELTNRNNKPYLFAVQWHPERMNYSNPLSGELAKRFLKESRQYSNK